MQLEVPLTCLSLTSCSIAEVFFEKCQCPQAGVTPGLTGETVPCATINLHFVGNAFALQHLLKFVGFFHRHCRVRLPVENQDRRQAAQKKLHLFWQSSEKFNHSPDARVDTSIRERKISTEGKAQQADSFGINLMLPLHVTDRVP